MWFSCQSCCAGDEENRYSTTVIAEQRPEDPCGPDVAAPRYLSLDSGKAGTIAEAHDFQFPAREAETPKPAGQIDEGRDAEDRRAEQSKSRDAEDCKAEQSKGRDAEDCPAEPSKVDDLENEPGTFIVDLEKDSPNTSIGLDLSVADGATARITGILPGIGMDWNQRVPFDRQLRFGDRIISANNVHGDARELLQTLRSSQTLHLVVRRPREFKVNLYKGDGAVGLDVSCKANRPGLLVRRVGEGLVQRWNETHPPDMQVKEKDFIIEINYTRGEPNDLLRVLKEATTLELVVISHDDPPLPE